MVHLILHISPHHSPFFTVTIYHFLPRLFASDLKHICTTYRFHSLSGSTSIWIAIMDFLPRPEILGTGVSCSFVLYFFYFWLRLVISCRIYLVRCRVKLLVQSPLKITLDQSTVCVSHRMVSCMRAAVKMVPCVCGRTLSAAHTAFGNAFSLTTYQLQLLLTMVVIMLW